MKLVVIIPAYNEAETVGGVIRHIPKVIEGIDEVEALVIDDGSSDNTAGAAREAGASVISHAVNEGLGATFSDGIKTALKMGADVIVNIDADNQFDSSEIPNLIKPILNGEADMVTGTRFFHQRAIPNMSAPRRWGNKFFVGLINILTGEKFTDTQCGFRAYSREAALRLNLFGGFTYTQEALLDLIGKGLKVKEIPIKVVYHSNRNSKISGSLVGYGLQALTIVLRTFRDQYPLKFFGAPGLAIFGIGFLGVLYSFGYWLVTGHTTPVRMIFFSASALVIFGLLLIILALVADMLKRIRRNQEEILYRIKKNEYGK